MKKSILNPPKIYLDTNHLINITKIRTNKLAAIPEKRRAAYLSLDNLIRNDYFGLIYNPAASFEWVDGNATLESAMEIAEVVDSAKLQYEMELEKFIYLYELFAELHRLNSKLILPEFNFLFVRNLNGTAKRPLPVLANSVPDFFTAEQLVHEPSSLSEDVPFGTAKSDVLRAWNFKQEKPEAYQERVDGFNAALIQDMNTLATRTNKSFQQQDLLEYMKRCLKIDLIVNTLNQNIDIDSLLKDVNLSRCPALHLFIKAREKRARALSLPKDNDGDDWIYLPIVPYADLVLTERNLRHFIQQADPDLARKTTYEPVQALKILQPWIG